MLTIKFALLARCPTCDYGPAGIFLASPATGGLIDGHMLGHAGGVYRPQR